MAVAESCQAWQGWKNGVEKVEIAAEWDSSTLVRVNVGQTVCKYLFRPVSLIANSIYKNNHKYLHHF